MLVTLLENAKINYYAKSSMLKFKFFSGKHRIPFLLKLKAMLNYSETIINLF